ncbi:alpha/beta hydrolase [Pleurocapsales cyanobacterium LEGE 06147]|nr:alpha/beta hydrolase [Pleurocapsales cyanobacterium LEGE 06147]
MINLNQFTAIRFVRLAILSIAIYILFCLFVFFFSDRLIFLPQPSSYQDTDAIIKLDSGDGIQISAIYLPRETSSYTILYSHGNAEDLGHIQPVLQKLFRTGLSVFAYDYRGYGTSEGTPSERNAYRDIDAAYKYLTQQLGVSPKQIIAHGRSAGGGVAVDLASRQPLAGLILESCFTSAFQVVTPISIVPFDKFRNIDKIEKVDCPVLVIHGKADEIVPWSHGQKLFAAANHPKLAFWVEGAGHNNVLTIAGEKYTDTLQQFGRLIERSL